MLLFSPTLVCLTMYLRRKRQKLGVKRTLTKLEKHMSLLSQVIVSQISPGLIFHFGS